MPGGWVYIIANRPFASPYVGVTNDIARRTWEHRERVGSIFTSRYRLYRLVYAEWHEDILRAIQREQNIKHWPRAWKLDLITGINPEWDDFFDRLNRWP